MKSYIFSLVFLLISAQSVFGQSKVYLGVKGGGQVASAYIEHTIQTLFLTTDFITGYQGGVMAKIFTKKRDALVNPGFQTGITYDYKGWGQVFPETDEAKYKVRLGYLQLPMEGIINFGRGKTKAFGTLGWYLEYLSSVSKSEQPDMSALEAQRIDFYTYETSRDKKLGYGVRASVGAQRDFPFGAIHLDVYGTFNISSAIDHQDFQTGIPDLSNLYTIGFTVGYLIPFGKLDY